MTRTSDGYIGTYSKIEKEGHRDEVVKMILESVPYRDIAERFGYTKDTVARFASERLYKDVAKGYARKRQKLTADFMSTMEYQQEKCQKVIEACHEWLLKPGRSGKYTLDPRADEIIVIYKTTEIDEATGKEKETRKECSLQELIDGRQDIVSLKYKYSDPRALIVSALAEARKQTELIAKVTGELKEISQTTDVYAVVTMVVKAITSETAIPVEARRRLVDDIEAGMAMIEGEIAG